MGNPKFPRKKFTTPLHPWKEERIKSERELIKKYGLKSHKEVWKAKTYLGKYRHQARELLAKMGAKDPQVKKESEQLLISLTRMGVLSAGSSLDDVLALETESILSRRLQTLVYLKGLSTTPDHSRQLINHGHIAIGDRKVTIPSYIVIKDEENEIGYTGRSPLNELSHPARPKADVFKKGITAPIEEKPEESKEPVKTEKKEDIVKDKKDEKTAYEKTEKIEEDKKIKEEKPPVEQETNKLVDEPKKDEQEKPNEEVKPEPDSNVKPDTQQESKEDKKDQEDSNEPKKEVEEDIKEKDDSSINPEDKTKKQDNKEGGN